MIKTIKPLLRIKQKGITLIELMVAMAVSSVIMLGVSNIYFSSKKGYVVNDEFARIQENGRYAVEVLTSDIRNAGYFGCASGQGLGTVENDLKTGNTQPWNFETGLMGYEASGTDINETKAITPETAATNVDNWATAAGLTSSTLAISVKPDAALAGIAIDGSDILVIRTTDGLGLTLANGNSGSANFDVVDVAGSGVSGNCANGICDEDIIFVSDCDQSIIFQASNVINGPAGVFKLVHSKDNTLVPGNKSAAWNKKYDFPKGAELMKSITKTYFVGLSNNMPHLFVRENAGNPVPVIEGIENMQLLYGVDTSGDGVANQFFSANDVPDLDGESDTVFDGVVSVKVSLLLRTPQDLPGLNRTVTDANSLTYAMMSPAPNSAITIDPVAADDTGDRHMRKVVNFTVKMRNKSFNTSGL